MDEARTGAPIPPSPALRLALGFLFSETGQSSRTAFDMFWNEARRESLPSNTAEGFGRQQHLTACMNWIANAVGMERTVGLMSAMGRARGVLERRPRRSLEDAVKEP